MIFSPYALLPARFLALSLWLGVLFPHPSPAQAVMWKNGTHDYVYRVFAGGFEVAEVTARYRFDNQHYAIESTLEGRGFLRSLLGIEGRIRARGSWQGAEVMPGVFESEAAWRGDKTAAEVIFRAGEEPSFVYTPAKSGFKGDEFPRHILKGTIDALSLSVLVSRRMSETGSCTLDARLFTGRHLLVITATDQGEKPLPENDILANVGSTHLCELSVQKVRSNQDPKKSNPRDNKPIAVDVFLSGGEKHMPVHPLLINATYRGINGKVWLSNHRFTP